jgi:hypothetical protein
MPAFFRLSNDRSFALAERVRVEHCPSPQTLATHTLYITSHDALFVGYLHHAWGLRGAGLEEQLLPVVLFADRDNAFAHA